MFTENDVVKLVASKLEDLGFQIKERHSTNERGIDIIATKNRETVLIEAKGETSSKKGSKRFGKGFNNGQKENHIARALLTVIKNLCLRENNKTFVGIALTKTKGHTEIIEQIMPVIQQLRIIIFFVKENAEVEIITDRQFAGGIVAEILFAALVLREGQKD